MDGVFLSFLFFSFSFFFIFTSKITGVSYLRDWEENGFEEEHLLDPITSEFG